MAQAKKASLLQNPGLVLLASFILLYVVNAVVLWVANMIAPENVVLGTMSLTPMWAVILTATALSLVGTFVIPIVHEIEIRTGKMWGSVEWMVAYLGLNFVTLWGLSRFSEVFGTGISSWLIVLVLAVVLDALQGIVMMALENARKAA